MSSRSQKKKILRGFEEDDNGTADEEDDVSFIERDLYELSEQLVSRGANWFNWNNPSKSYETFDPEKQKECEPATIMDNNDQQTAINSLGSTWFTWNNHDTFTEDELGETTEDATSLSDMEQHGGGWFNWNTAVDVGTPSRDGYSLKYREENVADVDDDGDTIEEEDNNTDIEASHPEKGWFSQVSNYFTESTLQDIAIKTEREASLEETEDERDDVEAVLEMSKSRSRRISGGRGPSSSRRKA